MLSASITSSSPSSSLCSQQMLSRNKEVIQLALCYTNGVATTTYNAVLLCVCTMYNGYFEQLNTKKKIRRSDAAMILHLGLCAIMN